MNPAEPALRTLRTYYLVSAITNALAFLFGSLTVVIVGVATFGCGCLFFVLPLINGAVMVFDFIAQSKVLGPADPKAYSFLRMVAIFDMVACLALVPLIMGILSIQALGKPEVYGHFHPAAPPGPPPSP